MGGGSGSTTSPMPRRMIFAAGWVSGSNLANSAAMSMTIRLLRSLRSLRARLC